MNCHPKQRHKQFLQDKLLCPTSVDNKKKQVFENFLLSVLHDQTSVKYRQPTN